MLGCLIWGSTASAVVKTFLPCWTSWGNTARQVYYQVPGPLPPKTIPRTATYDSPVLATHNIPIETPLLAHRSSHLLPNMWTCFNTEVMRCNASSVLWIQFLLNPSMTAITLRMYVRAVSVGLFGEALRPLSPRRSYVAFWTSLPSLASGLFLVVPIPPNTTNLRLLLTTRLFLLLTYWDHGRWP